jgi:glycosyltransferase involved in cell wall biosynthesis
MKVLMVFPYFATNYRNGIVSVVNNLPKALEKKNCEVTTIRFAKKGTSKDMYPKDDILVYADISDFASLRRLASEVKKTALAGKYDLVHGQGAVSALYKLMGSEIPCCVTNHGIGYKCYHFYWKYKVIKDRHDLFPYMRYYPKKFFNIVGGRLLYNKATRVIAVSDFSKNEVSDIYGVKKSKIDSIPNGAPIDLFSPNISKSDKEKIKGRYSLEKTILFLPPVPRKGLHRIIKALPIVLRTVPHFKLLVVGAIPTNDTYYEFCHDLSKKLSVEDKVIYAGWVDDADLPTYYSIASAYVLPSLYEPFGITTLESMACGTPVCAARNGGLPEIINDGEDGFLFDGENSAMLAEGLIKLLTDDKLRNQMGSNARAKVERLYSWDNIADQHVLSYEKTVQKSVS